MARAKTQWTQSTVSTKSEKKKPDYLYRKKKPDGSAWVYFRFKDGSLFPLPGEEGSPEFKAAYQDCLKTRTVKKVEPTISGIEAEELNKKRVAFAPGTLGWFIEKFLGSKRMTAARSDGGLADLTKRNYRKELNLMRSDKIARGKFGDLTERVVDLYCSDLDRTSGDRQRANRHRSLLSILWNFAKGFEEFNQGKNPNPTVGAKTYGSSKAKNPHQPWPPEVQEWFVATAPDYLVVGYYMLRFTGQRGSDATVMQWTDLERDHRYGDGINITQSKTGEKLWHKLPDELVAVLKRVKRVSPFIVVSAWGKPYATAGGLSQAIRRHFDAHSKPRHVMHGLRVTMACEVADATEGNIKQVKAVGGWKSDKVAEHYARMAAQRRLNAAAVGSWDAERKAAQADRKAVQGDRTAARRAGIRVVR